MARSAREFSLAYDDDFRGALTYTLIPVVVLIFILTTQGRVDRVSLVTIVCAVTVTSSLAYLAWTHVLFTRTAPEKAARIARAQYLKPRSLLSRLIGLGQTDAGSIALSMAGVTLAVAITAILVGSQQGSWLPLLVLGTAAVSWATMVYAFTLQYFRLHCGGERITFDIDEEPVFNDFLSMSVMVSSVGAMSAGTPRTRASLNAVRRHTWVSFLFNALVVAMTVSILGSLISSFGTD